MSSDIFNDSLIRLATGVGFEPSDFPFSPGYEGTLSFGQDGQVKFYGLDGNWLRSHVLTQAERDAIADLMIEEWQRWRRGESLVLTKEGAR